MSRLRDRYLLLRRRWPQFQMGLDALSWFGGIWVATLLRHELDVGAVAKARTLTVAAASAALFLFLGQLSGLYRRRFRYGSFDELAMLAATAVGTSVLMFAANLPPQAQRPVPASVPLTGCCVALVGLLGTRYIARLIHQRLSRPTASAAPVLIFGAGNAGAQLVASMNRNPHGRYRPVGLLDDNPAKANLSIDGVRVLGNRRQLAVAAQRTGATHVVLAIPSADGETLRGLFDAANTAGLQVRTLPAVSELMSADVDSSQIRDVTEDDLLGRRQIDVDLAAIAQHVQGKRVLVTGAGGSIGSELCRELYRFSPASLIMLDRDESALHAVQLSLTGQALMEARDLVVADIRDVPRLEEVFSEHRPQLVFHAAALKHLPLLEHYPGEGIKTNIWGTGNMLQVAERHQVEQFVNVSTDKAANPISVLGYTKRIAERLVADAAQRTGRQYLSVRFGNVLGSRGSVVPAFKAMIDSGGPLTVTDPDVTRFFMTIREAVILVIQASVVGAPGEVLILDMGAPVRIADVARRLVAASGKDVAIAFTGLRPGEKLHEELVGDGETAIARVHPLIAHATVPPLPGAAVEYLDPALATPAQLASLTAQHLAGDGTDLSARSVA